MGLEQIFVKKGKMPYIFNQIAFLPLLLLDILLYIS